MPLRPAPGAKAQASGGPMAIFATFVEGWGVFWSHSLPGSVRGAKVVGSVVRNRIAARYVAGQAGRTSYPSKHLPAEFGINFSFLHG
jgi:hypothetical protein